MQVIARSSANTVHVGRAGGRYQGPRKWLREYRVLARTRSRAADGTGRQVRRRPVAPAGACGRLCAAGGTVLLGRCHVRVPAVASRCRHGSERQAVPQALWSRSGRVEGPLQGRSSHHVGSYAGDRPGRPGYLCQHRSRFHRCRIGGLGGRMDSESDLRRMSAGQSRSRSPLPRRPLQGAPATTAESLCRRSPRGAGLSYSPEWK